MNSGLHGKTRDDVTTRKNTETVTDYANCLKAQFKFSFNGIKKCN